MDDYIVSARKYRPLGFDEVVGQNHITTTLHNAIKNNKLGQALLFCGPRGVGKTTCARIVARLVNEYKDNMTNSLNIFELDAASNNSVDDIRRLTEQVRFPPQMGRKKVYIIDEVHMLSNAAFNAFLKTLEEPPSYVIFILATTEKHKVLPTIISRCQIFDFNRIQISDILQQLKKVAQYEKIEAEENALYLIAQKADGALRDALSMFDLMVSFSSTPTVTFHNVIHHLHILDYEYYFKVVAGLLEKNSTTSLLLFDEIIKKGFDGHHFIMGLSNHIRNVLISQDIRTIDLIEVPSAIKTKYLDQAKKASPSLLLLWLTIAQQCDRHYKDSKNKRLTIELALMKMTHTNSVITSFSEPPQKEVKKKTELKYDVPLQSCHVVEENHISPPSNTTSKKLSSSNVQTKKITPDLTCLISNNNDTIENSYEESSSVDSKSNEPVSLSQLKKVWNEFAEQRKLKIGEYHMLKQPFDFKNNTVTLHLSNAVEEHFLHCIKTPLLSYLRTRLCCKNITVIGFLKQNNEEKIAYTNKEKLDVLVQEYPVINTLKNTLELDVDY